MPICFESKLQALEVKPKKPRIRLGTFSKVVDWTAFKYLLGP